MARGVNVRFWASLCPIPTVLSNKVLEDSPPSCSRHEPFPLSSRCFLGGFAMIFCLLPAVFTVTGFLTSHESHSQGEI